MWLQGPVALVSQCPYCVHSAHVLPLLCPTGNFGQFPEVDPETGLEWVI